MCPHGCCCCRHHPPCHCRCATLDPLALPASTSSRYPLTFPIQRDTGLEQSCIVVHHPCCQQRVELATILAPRLNLCQPPPPPPCVSNHSDSPTKTNSPAYIPNMSIAGATASGHTSSAAAMASNNLDPGDKGGRHNNGKDNRCALSDCLAAARRGGQAMLPSHASLALAFDADPPCTVLLDPVVDVEADGHGVVQAMAAATATDTWQHAVATAGC
jgi:hypothetical protein